MFIIIPYGLGQDFERLEGAPVPANEGAQIASSMDGDKQAVPILFRFDFRFLAS